MLIECNYQPSIVDFNSTKVQFGVVTLLAVCTLSPHFNSTKVQFGVNIESN